MFGSLSKGNRCFQFPVFSCWPWLHYDKNGDFAFCKTHIKAIETESLSQDIQIEGSFVYNGYTNCQNSSDLKEGFSKHSNNKMCTEATAHYITAPRTAKPSSRQLHVQS